MQFRIAIGVGVAVVAFIFFLVWSPKKLGSGKKYAFIEDPDQLREAEKLLSQMDDSGLVPLAVYNTDQGHSEANVVEIISFLETNGVRAIYKKTVLAILETTIARFYLFVAGDEVEKAKELLQQMQIKGL